eukprot:TRINITY_DN3322_c1_g3_i1.p1 TRINITY_DN3322_c1_g3~~TRINITY_DN3322_c1_g3_i1.p1  ORF type:complete len:181 (+),score=42.01 TRINITY_DN3322_c1_g3_i1:97-639(+)
MNNINSDSFEWPFYYNKPPFFTLQPVLITRQTQIQMWRELIFSYCKAKNMHKLDVDNSIELFNNEEIDRKLSNDQIKIIFDDLIRTNNAEWTTKTQNQINIFWKTINEWANLIYTWACNNGLNNSVCTLYEIREGDYVQDEEFYGLDNDILVRALKVLENERKAQMFTGNDIDSIGVKFF